MLEALVRGRTVYLVPELCVTTNISADIREQLPKLCAKKPQMLYDNICKLSETLQMHPKAKKIFDSAGLKLSDGLKELEPDEYEELPLPSIIVVTPNNDGHNVLTEQNAFSRAGFGRESGLMSWSTKLDRKEFHVRLCYEQQDEMFAKGWAKDIGRLLDRANAPVKFRIIEAVVVQRQGYGRAVHEKTRERTWDSRDIPRCLLFFNSRGGTDEYADAKRECMKKGIISQCVNVKKSQGSRQENAIKANLAKQLINKLGELVWWPEARKLREDCPSIYGAGGPIMMVGIDISHAPNEAAGSVHNSSQDKVTKKMSQVGYVAVLVNPNTGAMKTYSETFRSASGSTRHRDSDDASTDSAGGGEAQAKLKDFMIHAMQRIHTDVDTGRLIPIVPAVCIVYRDGISETELESVEADEVKPIEDALRVGAGRLGRPMPKLLVCHNPFFPYQIAVF
jgi:hypothetical protein